MKKLVVIAAFVSALGIARVDAQEKTYDLKLNASEVNVVMNALSERPFKEVYPLIMKMQGQLTPPAVTPEQPTPKTEPSDQVKP